MLEFLKIAWDIVVLRDSVQKRLRSRWPDCCLSALWPLVCGGIDNP